MEFGYWSPESIILATTTDHPIGDGRLLGNSTANLQLSRRMAAESSAFGYDGDYSSDGGGDQGGALRMEELPMSGDAMETDEALCAVPYMASRRWYLVAVAGTSLSIISLIFNVLIVSVLLRPKHSHFFFLGLLALSDSFLSFCYGPVIAMDIIKNRLQMVWLTRLWWSYVGPLLAMCHVSMTFSTFMIILATIERYLITVRSQLLACFRLNRGRLAIVMFLVALILRGSAIFEIRVVKNGNCTGLTEYEPILTPLVEGWLYETVFRFYIRTLATVFVPFFLLGYLNFRIVDTLRRQKRSALMFRFHAPSDHKVKIRSATRLLVLIVCSYLLANFLNVFITAWEYVDLESTQTEFTYDIYETLTDIISMLYILTCAIRFPVYIICNQEIRSAFYAFLRSAGCGLCRQKAATPCRLHVYYRTDKKKKNQQNGKLASFADNNSARNYRSCRCCYCCSRSDMDPDEGPGAPLTDPRRQHDSCCGAEPANGAAAFEKRRKCGGQPTAVVVEKHPLSDGYRLRKLSESGCPPIGTEFDRFVVAMALMKQFVARRKESGILRRSTDVESVDAAEATANPPPNPDSVDGREHQLLMRISEQKSPECGPDANIMTTTVFAGGYHEDSLIISNQQAINTDGRLRKKTTGERTMTSHGEPPFSNYRNGRSDAPCFVIENPIERLVAARNGYCHSDTDSNMPMKVLENVGRRETDFLLIDEDEELGVEGKGGLGEDKEDGRE